MALPDEEFERMKVRSGQPENLVQFFAESPLTEVTIDLERELDHGRTIDL